MKISFSIFEKLIFFSSSRSRYAERLSAGGKLMSFPSLMTRCDSATIALRINL
ncbi:MAG: hypothetical protein BWY89_01915 [Bacteroidetes bacterium ADurb.BinA012]|nr:MAG: hypothetical protein BWY89_01915 [Bacteroidetes bacterium ADurb.BinA012]